jgi:DNA-binding transcriptional regulator YhcF (GntR family)
LYYCSSTLSAVSPWEGFAIDPADRTPVYAQLERGIRSAIASGRLAVGDQLPTVRQLAVELRVNANTVAKVYAFLERAGVLETRRGVGTFIARATEHAGGAAAADGAEPTGGSFSCRALASRVSRRDAMPRSNAGAQKEHEPWVW